MVFRITVIYVISTWRYVIANDLYKSRGPDRLKHREWEITIEEGRSWTLSGRW